MSHARITPWLLGAFALACAACDGASGTGAAASTTGGSGGAATSSSGAGGATSSSGAGGAAIAACNKSFGEPCNPFGIAQQIPGLPDATYWNLLTQVFKVPFYQPDELFLDQGGACDRCAMAAQLGLKLVLVVRNNGGPMIPSSPPADMALYRKQLGQVIDQYKDSIAVVAIENEVNT